MKVKLTCCLYACLFLFIGILYGSDKTNWVVSPIGKIAIEFYLNKRGVPEFNILFKKEMVMKANRLELKREDADFSQNLKLIPVSEVEKVSDKYSLLHGKKKGCIYEANMRAFTLRNEKGNKLVVIFQVSDDGIGFRYFSHEQSEGVKKIENELTVFRFNDGTITWIQPMSKTKTGWNAVNSCYEEFYYNGIDIKNLPWHEPGWIFPALFKSGKYWIVLTETAPHRSYCGCRLNHDCASYEFKIDFPAEEEVFPGGVNKPKSKLPWFTPWRIICLSDNLGMLVESTIGTDLSKPSLIPEYSYVQPGRSSWSWVLLKDDSTIYSVQKRFID